MHARLLSPGEALARPPPKPFQSGSSSPASAPRGVAFISFMSTHVRSSRGGTPTVACGKIFLHFGVRSRECGACNQSFHVAISYSTCTLQDRERRDLPNSTLR